MILIILFGDDNLLDLVCQIMYTFFLCLQLAIYWKKRGGTIEILHGTIVYFFYFSSLGYKTNDEMKPIKSIVIIPW